MCGNIKDKIKNKTMDIIELLNQLELEIKENLSGSQYVDTSKSLGLPS